MSDALIQTKMMLGHQIHPTANENKRAGLTDLELVAATWQLLEQSVSEMLSSVAILRGLDSSRLAWIQFNPGAHAPYLKLAIDTEYRDSRISSLSPWTDDDHHALARLLHKNIAVAWCASYDLLFARTPRDFRPAILERLWGEQALDSSLTPEEREALRDRAQRFREWAAIGVGEWTADSVRLFRDLGASKAVPMPIALHRAIEGDPAPLVDFVGRSVSRLHEILESCKTVVGRRGITVDASSTRVTMHVPRGYFGK